MYCSLLLCYLAHCYSFLLYIVIVHDNCNFLLLFIVIVMYFVLSVFICYIVMPVLLLFIVISTMHETNLVFLTIFGCPPRDRRKLLQLVVY